MVEGHKGRRLGGERSIARMRFGPYSDRPSSGAASVGSWDAASMGCCIRGSCIRAPVA